ncbi:MAG: hypothetical protein WBA83_16695 [Burkholderiaceae bacterium]
MITITQSNRIEIDGKFTGLYVTQKREGTVVYSADHGGANYKEHKMPHVRYSTAHDAPASGAAGRSQFEADVRSLLESLS